MSCRIKVARIFYDFFYLFIRFFACILLVLIVTSDAYAVATKMTPPVQTSNGPVQGWVDEGVHTFLGVPYGAPPAGDLRFMPPQKPPSWKDIRFAIYYGRPAMQLSTGGSAMSYPGISGPALGQIFTSREDVIRQSEDCLVLNIWTPGIGSDKKRPVMVWFHGGGFNYGSGNWIAYSGHHLAHNHDVVVVTVNHRLNVFGYLNLAELGGKKYAYSGNAGQLDLVASLEWVRDNIANFGGDPGNVTILGQSGGGSKVSNLLAMPKAKGLIHKAIIQSGPGIQSATMKQSTENAKRLLAKLNISQDNLQALLDIPAEKLLQAAIALQIEGTRLRWGPVVDGHIIPNHPFDPAASPLCKDIPMIIGFTKDEQTLYNVGLPWWGKLTDEELLKRVREIHGDKAEQLIAAYRQLHPDNSPSYLFTDITTSRIFSRTILLAERKADQSAPVFSYIFNFEAPVEDRLLRAPHTIEIPFVFDIVDLAPILLGTDEETKHLGRLVSSAWTAFARTGNPNIPGLPQWPKYDTKRRSTMTFDKTCRVINDPMSKVRQILTRP